MKKLKNQDGIALITALMFTVICLAMVLMLMYHLSLETKMSSAQKRYRNSLEASYGGTEFITREVLPRIFANYSRGQLSLASDFGAANKLGFQLAQSGMSSKATLQTKLSLLWSAWPTGSARTVDPKDMPDFIFTLKGQNTSNDYRVYSKIVDTVPGVGIIDASDINYLDTGAGASASAGSGIQTVRTPHLFTVEVQAEAAINPREKAGVSVLYAY